MWMPRTPSLSARVQSSSMPRLTGREVSEKWAWRLLTVTGSCSPRQVRPNECRTRPQDVIVRRNDPIFPIPSLIRTFSNPPLRASAMLPDSFETARVLLRPVSPGDAGAIFSTYAQDEDVTRFCHGPLVRQSL